MQMIANKNLFPLSHVENFLQFTFFRGPRWRSWLRHCATNRQVAGSITDGAIGFFHWHNPVGHTVALGWTQPLIESFLRGKCGRCVGLTTYHLLVPIV
jgi:hypothetical protein